jgi:hypothetical protein
MKATDEHTDIVIRCGSDVYRAHKVIVCSQSDFFNRAFKEEGFMVGFARRMPIECA